MRADETAVVDMAPGVGKISPEFHSYINAMKEIEKAAVHSRKEADEILAEYEPVRPLYLDRKSVV